MWRILSLLPDSLTEWVALALVAGMAFLAGYGRGADDARQEYEARIAVMEKDRAQQDLARAHAVAVAEKSARERLATATARGNRLAEELARKTQELDVERASVNRRLAHVAEAARRDCAGLSADWVRLYNQALGLTGSGHNAASGRTGPGNVADASKPAGAAGTGIQPDALTTPEDLLAHVRDYGRYCRKLEAGYRALADYAENAHD